MVHDIILTDLETKRKFQFPSLPEKINVVTETSYAIYNILDYGEVQIPNGTAPDRVSWEGTFYGEARKDMSFLIRKWVSPSTAYKTLYQFKKNHTPLKLAITNTPVNIDVTIASFECDFSGGFGDYAYSISFMPYNNWSVTVTKSTANKNKSPNRTTVQSKTHTVQSGDTLWGIAQQKYGAGKEYMKIYNANKSIIESTAKKRGKKSSNNGHWIFPGTVLTIP